MRGAATSGLNCNRSSAVCNCRAAPPEENKLCTCLRDPDVNCSWGGDKIGCTYVNFTCDEPADCLTSEEGAHVCRHVGTSEMRFQFIDDNGTPCDNIITCTNVTIEPTAQARPIEIAGRSGTYIVV